VATDVKLPRLGQGMESGTIVKWLKAEGEPVQKGEPLYELDTDKVTQEVEADAGGVLLKIAVREGEVPVGTTIGVIGEQGEEIAEPQTPEPAPEPAPKAEEPGRAPAPEPEPEPTRASAADASRANGRIKASPLARRIARERGVDLASLRGTGPEGRIVAEDVERAGVATAPAAPGAAPAEVERVALTGVRRTIARRLTAAWQIPVFQLVVSADMGRANALLEQLRERQPETRYTVTDLLVKASATALMRHRDVNVEFTEEELVRHPNANVSIAVAAPQGLFVPVIREAERKSLAEIAAARAELVERARAGKLAGHDMEGGTFTISNLGMFALEQFTAVLNPPQAAIVAVGATEDRPVARDGELVIRPMVTLTATFDHRAVDGAPAASFLETLKAVLEEPGLAL
jgi:pyruvate dehydrogenase E2 component (dihydrolipoamide acetyltransferase)